MSKNASEPRAPRQYQPKTSSAPAHFRLTKKQSTILGVLLFALLVGGLYFGLIKNRGPQQKVPISAATKKEQVQPEQKIYSPLTGLETTTAQASRPVTGLIVENALDARPQSGIDEAGVVFESIAEGGITRFVALYQESAPQEVGPVRSLRPYLLDWLRPFDATIGHVGGSARALKLVRDGTWKDMDQFGYNKTFWRSTERRAPHNVYTSFEKIDQFNQSKNYSYKDTKNFSRKDDQKSSAPNASEVKLNISSAKYNSVYSYDQAANSYLRSQGGAPHTVKSGKQITSKVIVALISKYSIVQEDGSRSNYQTLGSGEAVIFQDGVATAATWSKADQASQIKLTDTSGAELKLNRGQTWFTILGSKDKLSWN